MPTIISGDGTITGLTSTGISAAQDLPATASLTTLGVTGNLSFNSGYGSSAVAYGCRAWVNFNGNGTVAIRGSGNVSSITDNGTGDYTVNFTTAMPDANYAAVIASAMGGGAGGFVGTDDTVLSSSLRFVAYAQNGSSRDTTSGYVSVFR